MTPDDTFVEELLAAGRAERPSPETLARVERAVVAGLAAGAIGGVGAVAVKAKGTLALFVAKGFLVLGVVAASGAAVVALVRSPTPRSASAPTMIEPRGRASTAGSSSGVAETVVTDERPATEPTALPPLPVRPPLHPRPRGSSATGPAPKAPAPTSTSSLARETALLRAVSDAVDAHDHAKATVLLAEYDAQFPNGVLRAEATLLRARAARDRSDAPRESKGEATTPPRSP